MLERTIRLCVSKINITGDIFRISKTVFLFIAVLLSPFILEANVSICEFYDNCEDTIDPLITITPEDCSASLEYITVTSCVDGAAVGPGATCMENEGPTVWFKILIDDDAAKKLITQVDAPGFDAIWSVYEGSSCSDMISISEQDEIDGTLVTYPCSNSDGDSDNIFQTPINPNVFSEELFYYVAVTAIGEIFDPNFSFSYGTELNCFSCHGSDETGFYDNCEETIEPLITITPEDCGTSLEYITVTSCVDGATEGTGATCMENEGPTVWFKILIDDDAAKKLITQVDAPGFDAVWSVYEGSSCSELVSISEQDEIDGVLVTYPCSNSDGEPDNIFQTPINPNVFSEELFYYVAITAVGEIKDPNFSFSYGTTLACISCTGSDETDCNNGNFQASILENGDWVEVDNDYPFCQGMDVQVCIQFEFNSANSGNDWFHGFIPVFGSGWEVNDDTLASFNPIAGGDFFSSTGDCAPFLNGYDLPNLCTYMEDGVLKLCNSACDAACPCSGGILDGAPLPSGYWFNTNGGSPTCGTFGCSPASFYGTPNGITLDYDFCFELKTKSFDTTEELQNKNDLQIVIQAFSDAITGCWADSNPCIKDPSFQGPSWEIASNLASVVNGNNQAICSNETTEILLQTSDGSQAMINVELVDNPNVSGGNDYMFLGSGTISDNLVNTTSTTQIVVYNITVTDLNNCSDFASQLEVTVFPKMRVDFDPYFICEGECTDLMPIISGGAGAPYTYEWSTGELSPSIIACPVVSTTYTVTITDSLGCEDVGEIEIDVKPPVEVLLPESISVCKDDDFDPFDPDYLVCLDFLSGSAPYSVQWSPEIGLIGEPFGINGECYAINELSSSAFLGSPSGTYLLTANVTDFFGCVGTEDIEVTITGDLTIITNVQPYECGDTETSVNVTGLDAAGNALTYFLLYGGCPDDNLGDFLEEYTTSTGTVTVIDIDLLNYTCYTIVGQTANGCEKAIDIEIPIIENNPIEISFSSDVCEGSDAFVSIMNSEEYQSFEWSPDIGSSGTFSFEPDSTQTYIVTATSIEGCISSESITITVHPLESIFCNDPCEEPEFDFQILGTAYSDVNMNGIYDSGDIPLSNVMVTDNSNGFTTFTNALGEYVLPVQEGVNSISASNSIGDWESSIITIDNINVAEPCKTGVDFVFTPASSLPDAQITVTNSITRCDWETRFYVTVENKDHESISGEVVFTFDEETSYFSSDIPNIQVTGNQLKFQSGVIAPFSQNTYEFKLKMPGGSANLPLLDFNAQFLQDQSALDEYEYSQQLFCSYDPNDKRTFPDREGEDNLTLIEESLDYTIRFQNNGNDTAFHVRIVDVLDPFVDKTSIRFNSSSHPYYACLMKDTLIIDFFDILLVDSTTNYPASQGFINFSIDIKDVIPEGTIVTNSADIIFDTNEPIVTNEVINTIVYDFCTDPVTEIATTICEGESYQGYSDTGIYQDTIITEEGCDSLVNIDLTVISPVDIDLFYSICEGVTLVHEGEEYVFDESGIYTVEKEGDSGCIEEVLKFNIEVIDTLMLETEQVTICEDEDFEGLTSTGVYSFDLIDPDTGCPVVRTVDLTVLPLTAEECTVSTTILSKNSVRIYPIPTTDKVYINSDYDIVSVSLYSTTGKNIYRSQIKEQKNVEIEVVQYQTGLYFIHIETEKGRLIDKIIVK